MRVLGVSKWAGLFGLILWGMEKGAVGCGLNHLDRILGLRNLQVYIAGSVSKGLSDKHLSMSLLRS